MNYRNVLEGPPKITQTSLALPPACAIIPQLMQTSSTFDLIDRIHKGDERAFSLLFTSYRRRLAVLIHYRLGERLRSSVEVEDILQETWLRAFRQMDHFTHRGAGSFMRWLALIAEHVIADEAKHRGRQKRHAAEVIGLRSDSNPNGADPADSETPTRVLALKEDLQNFLRKLDALPPDYRKVILLAKIEELTTEEIAGQLGRTREATALLLHRALKRFRQVCEEGVS
jgi:RNA polymerase sigma-70 factor (ECF subfamily)